MKINNFILLGLLSILISCKPSKQECKFRLPEISKAVQITRSGKEYFLASYYGINSWSESQKYILVLQTDIKSKLPDENDPAILGLVEIETKEFIPLAETRAWNFQIGCMAHWLGTSPDSLIIYNDFRGGKSVAVIMNVHTKKEITTIPYPINAVSPNGKEAISINFSRLRKTRIEYGFAGNGQDAKTNIDFPVDDGLLRVDLETGETKLLVSIAQIKDMVPKLQENAIEYFNCPVFSREGNKIFWLARAFPGRNTTCFTVNRDGTNIQHCFPPGWDGSHFDWLNDDELMITANYEGKQYTHVLFTVGEQNYKRLGNGILDFDGHGTFSPNGKWLLTDTYPSKGFKDQVLYLMDMETGIIFPLGRYNQPEEFSGFYWRCDIHARWNPSSNMIAFNSTHTGSRQVYLITLN